jgi:hypothetical protein
MMNMVVGFMEHQNELPLGPCLYLMPTLIHTFKN